MSMPSYHGTPVSSPGVTSVEVPLSRSSRPSRADLSELGVAPGTPFGATLSTPELVAPKSKALWVAIGGLALLIGVGSAVALGGPSEEEPLDPQPAVAPVDTVADTEPEETAPTVAPSEPDAVADSGSTVVPAASVVTAKPKPRPWRPSSKQKPAAKAPTAPVEPAASSKPKPRPKPNGFVPPPMTDPGF
jgi:hypothetical protein